MELKCCCGDTAIRTAPRASCLCTQSRCPAAVGTHTCVPTCARTPVAPPSPSAVPPAQRGVAQGARPGRPMLCVTRPCAALRRDPCSSDTVPAVVPGARHMAGKAPLHAPFPAPIAPAMASSFVGPEAPPCLSSEADEMWSSHFARLTAARPCSLPASQEGLWGEGDEDPVPAEPRGSGAPLGVQPQPDPLVQTCLLRDLEMGPLAQTQTLRDFEQVRPRGAGTPHGTARALPAPPGAGRIHGGCPGHTSGVWSAGGVAGQVVRAEGEGPSPAGRHAPLTALTAATRGASGARVSPTRCPRSSDSSNSSGRRKKKEERESSGASDGSCGRAGSLRLCPGGAM